MIEDEEMRMMKIIAGVKDKKYICTILGCGKSFNDYDKFSKHLHNFHGIDEM